MKKMLLWTIPIVISITVQTTAWGQTDPCQPVISGIIATGQNQVNSPIKFTVYAVNPCNGPVYYRFSYHPDYGTDKYDGTNWKLMGTSEYIVNNYYTFNFPTAGKYVVVVWAVADVNNIGADVPLIGFTINIVDTEGKPVRLDPQIECEE